MKFKAPIEVESSLVDSSNSSGSAGQVLTSTGVGVDWIDPTLLPAESAEKVIQTVRFGEAVSKGDPLVITGYHGSNGPAIVERADATDATKMPAYGVALEDYANNATGLMIAVGDFNDFDTSSYSVGDTLYVAVGGGMTNVKPTGTALIQNMGIVSRSNANNGDVEIVAIGRTNDVPNLPTGRLFVGTSGNTSLTSDVVYIDDANDRVGIGTDAPSEKLHIVDSTGANINLSTGGNIGGINQGINFIDRIGSGAGADGQIGSYIRSERDGTAARYDITFGTVHNNDSDAVERMRIDSGGNVGIGTTSPTNGILQIGDSNTATTIAIAGPRTKFGYNGTNAIVQGGLSKGIAFCVNNETLGSGEAMRINSSGNLGIGTTSPSEKLDLGTSGAFKITQSGITEVYIEGTGVRLKNIYTSGGWARGILTYENSAGTDYFQLGALGSSQNFTYAYIGPAYNTAWQVWTNTGNVGIGTTSPNTLLDVSSVNTGATAPTVRITNTRESGAWAGFTDDLGRFEFFTDDVSGNAPYTLGYVGIKNDWTGSLPSGAMVFATTTYNAVGGAVERMRITSDGEVGIGTTNPSYKLDVTGEGRFTGDVRGLSFITTSQRDQKENINNIDKSKAKAIPFKEYTYKSSIDGSARKRYGVIAEDIENDYPELVHTGADGVKGINYIDLLVKRVAELEKELEDISLTPGPKGDTGDTGPQGPSGSNGNDGNSHLSNVDSITFDERSNQLVLTINRTDFRFSPVR